MMRNRILLRKKVQVTPVSHLRDTPEFFEDGDDNEEAHSVET